MSAFIRICLCISTVLCAGSLICLRLRGRNTHRGAHLSAPPRHNLTSCSAARTPSLSARWTWADGGSFARWANRGRKQERWSNFGRQGRWIMCVCVVTVCICVCVCPAEVKVEWERQCAVSEEHSYHRRWTAQLISQGHTGSYCVCVCVCVCLASIVWLWSVSRSVDVSLFCSVSMDDANGVTCVSKEKEKMAKALAMCLYFYPVFSKII